MAKTMQPLMFGHDQVYIDLDCGMEVTTWNEKRVQEYGPIEEQGCDRCESAVARWTRVWVEQ